MIPRHRPPFNSWHMMLAMFNSLNGIRLEEVEKRLSDFFEIPYALLLPSARAGISWALRTSITPGTSVVCTAYTCKSVHEAIIRAGGSPYLIDTSKNSFLMDLELLRRAQTGDYALVLCELYGCSYDFPQTAITPQTAPRITIVDMAMTVPHAGLISRLQKNDVGVVSFGIGKCMYSGWGGMCFTHDSSIAKAIKGLRKSSVAPGGSFLYLKRCFSILLRIMAHNRLVYGSLRKIRGPEQEIDTSRFWSDPKTLSREWFLPSSRIDRALIFYNAKKSGWYVDTRISLAKRYRKNLAGVAELILPPVSHAPLSHFTIQVDTRIRPMLREYLWKHGIDTGILFSLPPYLSRAEYPHACMVASQVLNLPLYPSLCSFDVDWICEKTIHYLKKCNL